MDIKTLPKAIQKAIEFNASVMHPKTRLDGSLCSDHGKRVGLFLCEIGASETTIVSAILHDVLEDTMISPEILKKQFGRKVLFLVQTLTKEKDDKHLLEKVKSHPDAMMIKVADNIDNLMSLDALPDDRRKRYVQNALEINTEAARMFGRNHPIVRTHDHYLRSAYITEHVINKPSFFRSIFLHVQSSI